MISSKIIQIRDPYNSLGANDYGDGAYFLINDGIISPYFCREDLLYDWGEQTRIGFSGPNVTAELLNAFFDIALVN